MIYPALLGPFKFMPNCSVGPSKWEKKFASNILVWAMRKCIVSMATPLYGFREWGVGLQIQSFLGFYLS